MSLIQARMPAVPSLPLGPKEYDKQFIDQFATVLRLYFNQLNNVVGQLVANQGPYEVYFGGATVDSFGRLRTSNPYPFFDSQNRYAADNQFDTSTATGGSTTYLSNESSVALSTTTSSGSEVVRQTYRVFPYQPGKGLTFLGTFVMSAPQENLRQRVGYFNTANGVFLQQNGTTVSFVLRSSSLPTPGTPSDIRTSTLNGSAQVTCVVGFMLTANRKFAISFTTTIPKLLFICRRLSCRYGTKLPILGLQPRHRP